jgi:hypothetical protein
MTQPSAPAGRETPSDADAQPLADEAERGYDVDALIARHGKRERPLLDSASADTKR